jgi:hypothetical protein
MKDAMTRLLYERIRNNTIILIVHYFGIEIWKDPKIVCCFCQFNDLVGVMQTAHMVCIEIFHYGPKYGSIIAQRYDRLGSLGKVSA